MSVLIVLSEKNALLLLPYWQMPCQTNFFFLNFYLSMQHFFCLSQKNCGLGSVKKLYSKFDLWSITMQWFFFQKQLGKVFGLFNGCIGRIVLFIMEVNIISFSILFMVDLLVLYFFHKFLSKNPFVFLYGFDDRFF